ncbi:uncharacterized protein LOC132793199 isoform X2 [Drosophila nasuta]|nr:uncharacterized protein LOC132793199 isoform X2 [Drosophila nasuta]
MRSTSQQTPAAAASLPAPATPTPAANLSSFASASGGMQVNVEKVQEHISKLISQNEAIVENKEILLQKKYPKQLNRSRSFNNANNSNSNASSSNSSSNIINNISSNSNNQAQLGETKVNLAQAIVQKQQQQQLQQQQQQQQQLLQQQQYQLYMQQQQQQQQHMEPVNGLLKRSSSLTPYALKSTPTVPPTTNKLQQQLPPPPSPLPLQTLQYRQDPATPVPKLEQQPQQGTPNHVQPLNLSAKPKPVAPPKQPTATSATVAATAAAAPSLPPTAAKSTANAMQQPNNSIIKNLLLNARGLAVPIGEGDDAVYSCPICANEFRSPDELKLHNSTYCQDASSSAPMSPASSPSSKYFRSNSISFSLPELKSHMANSKNPLSLAKLAWSQLKTKPSSLVLSRLSAAQSPARTSTVTASSSSSSSSNHNNSSSNHNSSSHNVPPTIDASNVALRFVDAPLPSPGPLLGKTPLVDYAAPRKTQDTQVVITKMHEDRVENIIVETPAKRAKLQANNDVASGSGSNNSAFALPATAQLQLFGGNHELQSNSSNITGNYSAKEERLRRFTSSGGTMIPISECPELNNSPKMIRTPLLSGGSFQEMSPRLADGKDRKLSTPSNGFLLNTGAGAASTAPQHFQFPPINSITAFNPLTLPPMSSNSNNPVESNKAIPYVPGIPGPGSLSLLPPPQQLQLPSTGRGRSPNRKQPSPNLLPDAPLKALSPFGGVQNLPSEFSRQPPTPAQRNALQWNSNKAAAAAAAPTAAAKQPFNFLRMADNVKATPEQAAIAVPEVRHFNFDNVHKTQQNQQQQQEALAPLHVDTPEESTSAANNNTSTSTGAKSKFLRPTSLPLKPGTFTPKRHHGITPTANTLPLISPETPRPSKSCVQLYLNGHAYTYLGLKCSTKMFYCTVNCPQPSYVAGMHKLSMYSVWQVCEENQPHPLGFKPKQVMALYDSRQKLLGSSSSMAMAGAGKMLYSVVSSQQTVSTCSTTANGQSKFYQHQLKQAAPAIATLSEANVAAKASEEAAAKKLETGQLLVGGYESHEDYTYIRGRGRGRYVCSECGIRCKKPSMLKKHIRTHTDVRPFTCSHCNFSFKTKGNLTKHMQSKTHFKKCIELGINPGPMPADGEFLDVDVEFDQQSSTSAGGRTSSMAGESDSDDYSDNESESSDTDESKSRQKEHEAARGLLSLSMTPPIPQSVSPYPAQLQDTPVPAASPANSIGSSAGSSSAAGSSQPKRLVCSFTSPKPPFDYQKQEQYYSNPEESKPKRGVPSDESSAPMDLTKPRSAATPIVAAAVVPVATPMEQVLPKSQAQQMRDVIFGAGNNECGFMKTLISVSDKVRISAEMEEQAKRETEGGGDDVLLQTYIKEQALQYAKMKQSQFSRSYLATSSTNSGSITTTSCSSSNTTMVSSSSGSSQPKPALIITELPSIEVHEVKTPEPETPPIMPLKAAANEEDEAETPADQEQKPAVVSTAAIVSQPEPQPHAAHNANLPAAVQQPDANDFSGVLSGNNSNNATSAATAPAARTVIVGEDGFKTTTATPTSSSAATELPTAAVSVASGSFAGRVGPPPPPPMASDARPTCSICNKQFQRQHQLTLHMNIHYMERKFKCEPCSISFRTQGHLQKHERSEAHKNKVMMTSTFGVPTTSNPRPFECTDCKIAFRIHGHLAKHLRSKTHVQKLECLQKLPFGTYAEIERAGISLTEIDTSDCDNSLISLKLLAQKLLEKDPNKLSSYTTPSGMLQLGSDTPAAGQDSASEDGFSAANSAAASAIASLDNDSAGNTPQRASSMSEDETLANGLTHSLKRRLPGSSFSSNGDESDNPLEGAEKRARSNTNELNMPSAAAATAAAAAAAAAASN